MTNAWHSCQFCGKKFVYKLEQQKYSLMELQTSYLIGMLIGVLFGVTIGIYLSV